MLNSLHAALTSTICCRLSYYGGGHYDSLVGADHAANLIRETPGQWEQRHIEYSHRINSRETHDDVAGVEQQVQAQSDRERTEVEQLEQILMVSHLVVYGGLQCS